jgi:lycopene cyclase domain-containing protein
MSRHDLPEERVTYTELCVVALVASLVLDLFVLRTRLVTRRAFWVSYAIIIGFQLLTNGWLTGRRIVTYNADVVIGGAEPVLLGSGRLFYAPVEDIAFGFALVLQTLAWWVFWGRRGVQREIRQSASEPPRVGQQAP